ncbi:MAG: tetratricopeptide repeat protein [Anaeromyxobacteraceae bacterium]
MRFAFAAFLLACACASGPSHREKERSEIHYNLGAEALRAGRVQDALKEFDEALAADENFADAHLGRGLVMEYGFGKLDDAEKHYRRAIELRPAFPEAHNNLGQLLAKRGRLSESVVEFDEALANMMYAEPYIARCNKGEALYRLGRRDEGIAELQGCLKTNPRYCLGYRTLGRIHLEEGRPKLALESFDRYAQNCPTTADAWYQVGVTQLKVGDASKATQAFQRCEDLAGQADLGAECRRSREMLQ